MKAWKLLAFALLPALLSRPSLAALPVGEVAPEFSLTGALAGETFSFDLSEQLKQGPVVVYFYPKAFTPGCTIEAHEFAEASDDFAQLGARVFGISTDAIDTVKEFSVSECRNKFAVLADPEGSVVKQYDAQMGERNFADRISYVIVPGGEIIYVHETREPKSHIEQTLKSLRQWRSQ